MTHGLEHEFLDQAGGTPENVKQWRESFPSIPPRAVKRITNMISYGNAGKEWLKEQNLTQMPTALAGLRAEVQAVVNHLSTVSSEDELLAIKGREHPLLTLMSIHCQKGERKKVDTMTSHLPPTAVCHGYLGDSILVNPMAMDIDGYKAKMMSLGIWVETKTIPANIEEYWAMAADIIGHTPNQADLSTREARRDEARAYAQAYLDGKKEWKPDQEFAIAIEAKVNIHNNHGMIEYYDSRDGVWYESGGDKKLRNEDVTKALVETFCPRVPQLVAGNSWRP